MDYIYIRAWGYLMGSESRYINDEVQKAHDDKAPGSVIYKKEDGTWAEVTDIASDNRRQQVEREARRIQAIDNPPHTRTII